MRYIDCIKDYKDYKTSINIINHKKGYISENGYFYKIKPYGKGFSRTYKVTAVSIDGNCCDEYWYTDDLFSFIKEGFINLYIER